MSLDFLRATPERAYRKVEADLRLLNPSLDMRPYRAMSSVELDGELSKLAENENRIYANQPYASWYSTPEFNQTKMLQEALGHLREYKADKESREVLAPGFAYYKGVQQFGHKVQGEMCHYLGEGRPVNWVKFIDAAPILKATEMLRHGDHSDFRKIYVEMADGRADGLSNITIEHLTESSDEALLMIEQYCDSRWEGPWPWETPAPYKLRKIIEDKKAMKQQSIQEMHAQLNDLLQQLTEGEAEKFEVLQFANDMKDKIQAMIENLARLAGEGIINLKDKLRSAMGDEATMRVEHTLTQPINMAADMLSKLKVSVEQVIQQIQSQPGDSLGMSGGVNAGMDGMGGAPGGMGGGMGGTPGDAMGGAPPGGGMAPDADAQMTDDMAMGADDSLDQPERAMKGA